MNQTELFSRLKRAEDAAATLASRLDAMLKAHYALGQIGCGIVFDAGMKIADLERELTAANPRLQDTVP